MAWSIKEISAVHSGSDPVLSSHNRPPARVRPRGECPARSKGRGRPAHGRRRGSGTAPTIQSHRARPLGEDPVSLKSPCAARQRRQAHAVVHGATATRSLSRFSSPSSHPRTPEPGTRPQGRPPSPAPRTDGHTARATNPWTSIMPFQQRHVSTPVRQMRLSGANGTVSRNECPQPRCSVPRVRSRLSTACRVFAQPLHPPQVSCAQFAPVLREERQQYVDLPGSPRGTTAPASVKGAASADQDTPAFTPRKQVSAYRKEYWHCLTLHKREQPLELLVVTE